MPIDPSCAALIGGPLFCFPTTGFSDWVLYEGEGDRRFDFMRELPPELPFTLEALVAHRQHLRAGLGTVCLGRSRFHAWWLTFSLREGFLRETADDLVFRDFRDPRAQYNLSLSPKRPELEVDFNVPIVAWAKHEAGVVHVSGYGRILEMSA